MKLNELPAPFIIADIGSNYRMSNNPTDNLVMAKRHIHDAAKAGVSAVKFQYYTDKELYGMEGPNKYHIPPEWIPELAAYCAEQSVEFMCTAFSEKGYEFINEFVNVHKVASCEMKHVGVLKTLARTNKPFLISTGGANQGEVSEIGEYLYDMDKEPGKDFGFLECVANYPADPSDYNLKVLAHKEVLGTCEEWCGVQYLGVSDHTKTNVVAITSVGLGATIFEKHFTAFDHPWGDHLYGDDRQVMTPDYPVSIGPIAMTQYVRDIRQAFKSLGTGHKMAKASEKEMTLKWRRRLKVTDTIKEGQILKFGLNFGIYRSITEDAEAAGPEAWPQFEGGVAKRDLNPGDPVWTTTVAL